jgi:hypothetical protein
MKSKDSASGHGQLFSGEITQAIYQVSQLRHYQGNPLIEALPPIWSKEEVAHDLGYYPEYTDADRDLPTHLRLHMLLEAANFFVPLSDHIEIEQRFSRIIRAGYRSRNPTDRNFWQNIDREVQELSSNVIKPKKRLTSKTWSLAILGISGVGKSTAIEMILSLYPQVILHNHYRGRDFNFTQIVWLKLECPSDGSTRGLCLNFFQAVDDLLGTNYYQNYTRGGKATKNEMLPRMARVAALHSIGVLVIDEIQDISEAKSGGDVEMSNFFVELMNTIRMPIVLVGTYKAMSILTKEFRKARRSSELGEKIWNRMVQDSTWDFFLGKLWEYQYVRSQCPMTSELSQMLYEVSQGITDFAVKIYLAAQVRAMVTGTEKITKSIIKSVAADSFPLAQSVLIALKTNNMAQLAKIEDVHLPMELDAFIFNSLQDQRANHCGDVPETSTPASSVGVDVIETIQPSDVKDAVEPDNSTSVQMSTSNRSGKRKAKSKLNDIVSDARGGQLSPYDALKQSGYIRPLAKYLESDAVE